MSHFKNTFYQALIETPLGPMLAIADNKALHLLEFTDRRGLDRELEKFRQKITSPILPEASQPIVSIENELGLYFDGALNNFKTPLFFEGTPFQNQVWDQLLKIPVGETASYSEIANKIHKATAFRAVAQAIGSNQLAIIIPCHRVINANGNLGGYAGGLARKDWLLKHECS